MARCIIDHSKICNHCGTCDDRCEYNPHKVCDNCFQCLEQDQRDFAEIMITDILTETDESAFETASLAFDLDPIPYSARTLHGVKGTLKRKKEH